MKAFTSPAATTVTIDPGHNDRATAGIAFGAGFNGACTLRARHRDAPPAEAINVPYRSAGAAVAAGTAVAAPAVVGVDLEPGHVLDLVFGAITTPATIRAEIGRS